eukprot:CAMPEP_0174367220 /NCGR_PEP_ID=MMETSP0811_2-20130205/84424_1 /TAXON_ID=73025 ORGANISM="Eutreptiella gymnastica-like, Strain CCMP1594" /NCGR_SAMPLE_ID=MMETSP0811_2 /ASSEMBLY_ACC=CAM_ASM_000667 /LENGTH=48 /DNA_ID= /DNA_START= /DNA_END= /DNA_ORIENTATION=
MAVTYRALLSCVSRASTGLSTHGVAAVAGHMHRDVTGVSPEGPSWDSG